MEPRAGQWGGQAGSPASKEVEEPQRAPPTPEPSGDHSRAWGGRAGVQTRAGQRGLDQAGREAVAARPQANDRSCGFSDSASERNWH